MNQETVIEETKSFVKNKLLGEGSGHDWWHIVRVYNNAIDIATHEENVDLFVVKLAALLHDIADHKFGYTDTDREKIISEFLSSQKVDKTTINNVVYIANNISFKGGTNKHVMQTIEGKIVQDADRLDAIGAIGIGRTFAYGGHVNREMYNPELRDKNLKKTDGYSDSDTITHFYEKLLLLKDKMNTETGRNKAAIRHTTMENYLKMFYSEWNGEI